MYKISLLLCVISLCTFTFASLEDAKEKAKQNAIENLSQKIQGICVYAETQTSLTGIKQILVQTSKYYVLAKATVVIDNINPKFGFVTAKASITRSNIVDSLEQALGKELSQKQYLDIRFLFPKINDESGYAGFTPMGDRVVKAIREARMTAAIELAKRMAGSTIESIQKVQDFVVEDDRRRETLEKTLLIGCSYSKPEVLNKTVEVNARIKTVLFAHSIETQLKTMGLTLSQDDHLSILRLFQEEEGDSGLVVIEE